MKSTRTVRAACLAATALGALATSPVHAQATGGKDAPAVGDIIVTARRTEERLQDVPISITVFNQQQLTNANIINSEDLARVTPSLSANSNFGSDNSSFAIRGFIQENGTAPSVGVYFADVVAPRAGSNGIPAGDGAGPGSFFDLQDVQVLKGPQGTLFGRNTTGGAVLLVPQKPTAQLGGYIEGSYGNYDMRRVQGAINVPLSDTVRVRLSVDHQLRDGYLNNTSGIGPRHLADLDYTAVRGSIVIDVTPNLESYTIGSYSNSHNHGDVQKGIAGAAGGLLAAGVSTGQGYYDVASASPNPSSKLKTWQVINTTTWRPADTLTIKNIVSYAQLKDDLVTSLFGVDVPFTYAAVAGFVPPGTFPTGTYSLPFTEVNHPANEDNAHESTLTEELQLQGSAFADRLTWQAGGYLESARPIGQVGQQSSFLASCINTQAFQCTDPIGLESTVFAGGVYSPVAGLNVTTGRTSFHDVAVYGQATYKIADHFKLTGGLRYTWDHEDAISFQTTSSVDFPPNYGITPGTTRCTQPLTAPSCINNLYEQSSKPTWLIDLDYTPNDAVLAYAKYARGYRAGTIAPNITAPLNIVKPESVDAYEVGLKTTFHAPIRMTLDVSAFYNELTNQQIQVGFNAKLGSGLSSTAAPINAGASRIYGLEFSGSFLPFDGMVVDVGYTYLNAKITKVADFGGFDDPNFALSATFNKGDPIVLTPRNKVVVSPNYTLPFAPAIGKVSVGMTFTHTDRQLANYADRDATDVSLRPYSYLPATNLVDVNVSWANILKSGIGASFFVTNLTDDKYYVYAPGLATAGLGFETVELGQPRMYGGRLKYTF